MAEPEKQRRWRLGLRLKLTLASLLLIFAPVLVIWSMGLAEYFMRRGTAMELQEASGQLLQQFSVRGAGVFTGRGTTGGAPWLQAAAREAHVMVRVIDPAGRVLWQTSPRHAERWSHIQRGWFRRAGDFFFGPAGPPDARAYEAGLPSLARRPEVLAALAGKVSERWRHARDSRLSVFNRAVPLPGGRGALLLTRYSRRSVRALYDLRYQVLKLTLWLAAVAALLGLWTGWRIVTPLVRIQRYIHAYLDSPRGAGPPPPTLGRRDEVGDLGRDLRELTSRLDRRLEQTATMAGDLAHDLKNPIATVGATAELLQGPAPLDEQRRQRIARALAETATHMNRSVEGMLELARLDQRLADTGRAEVDLAALSRELLEQYRQAPGCEDVELTLELKLDHAPITGVEQQLERALRNLLENALTFCAGRVQLHLQRQQQQLLVTVCDDGPGVSAGNRDKIFRRFFSARPRGEQGDGLGLTAVQAIAQAHGGTVELLEQGPLPGACFQLRLRM